ncbi:MAG: hypothetical protein ND895_14485 [Pyrinomonadaceae bacterium]|nr:hypothetical protein [Pyrinomonadaceae bacterium]
MKIKKHMRTLPVVALSLLVLGSAGAFAQKRFMVLSTGRPEVKVQLAAFVERDKALVPVEKVSMVVPGDVLDWTITSANEGNAAAIDYKAVGHIPEGMTFVAGSAKADGSVNALYSIDKGKSFSTQPMIEEKQADGSVKQVPAPVSMYTDVRYEWSDPLVQGAKLSASYKVRVN